MKRKNIKQKRNNMKQIKPKRIVTYLIILVLLIDAGVFSLLQITSHANASTPIGQTNCTA